jgi:hypothetical protein
VLASLNVENLIESTLVKCKQLYHLENAQGLGSLADETQSRCYSLERRWIKAKESSASNGGWQIILRGAVSKISWGMPGCPVERKTESLNTTCSTEEVLSHYEARDEKTKKSK